MIPTTEEKSTTPRDELNLIASQSATEESSITEDSLETVLHACETVDEAVRPRIETFATDTPLSSMQAEIWVLRSTVDSRGTRLTYGAIALAMRACGSPFGRNWEPDGKSSYMEWPTEAMVKDIHMDSKEKFEEARDFVGASTFYNREEVLESPAIVWLGRDTIDRLEGQSRGQPADTTLDDVVTQLLAETESRLTLEELTHAYLTARGDENIAQIVLHEGTSDSTLWFRAYGNVDNEPPDVIAETDAIEVGGQRYDFYFDEDPYWPDDRGGIVTLYAAERLKEIEPISPEHGIEAVRERVTEAAEQGGFDSLAEQ